MRNLAAKTNVPLSQKHRPCSDKKRTEILQTGLQREHSTIAKGDETAINISYKQSFVLIINCPVKEQINITHL